ncbi:hypothetical protein [endosymbiont GvMRE of Glomus versiforme]|uniref:hypothetical protein n=1 Tax=endosymbiont GvMRE of Glomus versiforme TaxID=2039283 RepID=UPI000EE17906|nr:hypothetical protein [endosymbiont GvMRE of Glomus versiforme]RHZ35344.1 hypothetical protein GvMRE_IIg80 [endosymbiont GvMRE of Glomus versiforme]
MIQKRENLSPYNYSYIFLSQAVLRSSCWAAFILVITTIGKRLVETDFLEAIYKLFGKSITFSHFFIGGTNVEEKYKLLNYISLLAVGIMILEVLSLLINNYLWKRDKYIENNNFYLHNKLIFIFNSLIHAASAFLLTFSFISFFTVILSLTLIIFNTVFFSKKREKEPQLEVFFSWNNIHIREIFIYSIAIIFILPLVIGRFQKFNELAKTESSEGLAKIYQEFINSSDIAKQATELLITKGNYSLFHWIVLVIFIKNLIKRRNNEFSEFWTKVNEIEKKASNFVRYYYYQENWAITNNITINLSDYNYLKNIPNFLNKNYLEEEFNVNNFSQQNKKVVKYIEFCWRKIKEQNKRNFFIYCLFNEFSSWDDCMRTEQSFKNIE